MRFLRFLASVCAAALLLISFEVYPVGVAVAAQKERLAHSKKPTQFHYVCPMHEDVTSKKQGTCPKCKMKLVKKPIVQEPTTSSN
jgi:Heavy metal binding domain